MDEQRDLDPGQTEALRRLSEIGSEATRLHGPDTGLVMACMRREVASLDEATRAQLEDALRTMLGLLPVPWTRF